MMINTRLLITTLVAASAAMTIPALAADLTWTGSTNGNWNTTTENWSGDGDTFTAGDNVTFDASGTNTTISLTEDITAGTISVSGSTGYSFSNGSGSDSVSLTATSLDLELTGWASLKIDTGVNVSVGTFYHSNTASDVLEVNGSFTVTGDTEITSGYTTQISANNTGSVSFSSNLTLSGGTVYLATKDVSIGGQLDVASGSTLNVGSTGNSWATDLTAGSLKLHGGGTTIEIATDSTVTVSGTLDLNAGASYTDTIQGNGTLNVASLELTGGGTFVISVANVNVGEITDSSSGGSIELTATTVGLYNTDSLTTAAALWLNDTTTGTTFNTENGQTMTLSGALTGGGALVKTGEGTLTLSGENSYYAGTTISAGTVVAASSSALGTGDVTVASGATLDIEAAITIGQDTDSKTITFNEGAILVIGESLLEAALTESDDGEVASIADDAPVTIITVAGDDGSIVFGSTTLTEGSDISDLVNGFISSDITSAYDLTWTFSGGALAVSATATPEPSMFGLLAGLGALGLVATRRRRNRKA